VWATSARDRPPAASRSDQVAMRHSWLRETDAYAGNVVTSSTCTSAHSSASVDVGALRRRQRRERGRSPQAAASA
jgi:hypothetical protein